VARSVECANHGAAQALAAGEDFDMAEAAILAGLGAPGARQGIGSPGRGGGQGQCGKGKDDSRFHRMTMV
jgi:hypothetical protein